MITGALLLFIGLVIGWILRSLPPPRRRGRFLPQRETVCGCTHHLSMHDPKTGHCNAPVQQADGWNGVGTPIRYRWYTCGCRQYVGPEPMTEFVAAELPVEGSARQVKRNT